MSNLLANLLSPIYSPMGVSTADFTSYLKMCSGYIYAILAALVIMVVVLAAAGKAKKGLRGLIRWNAVLAMIAVIAVCVNLICFGPMYTNVSGALNAAKVNLSAETVAGSKEAIRKVGEEGLVLVKNNGLLPLSSSVNSLNVFGWGSTNPIFGGTGSGSSDGSSAVGILQSLKEAGYTTNEELTKLYTDYRPDRPVIDMHSQDWTLPEPTADAYTDAVMSQAKDFSDTAVIVISRSGGENADLPTDMYALIHGTYNIEEQVSYAPGNYDYFKGTYTNNGSYDDFEQGEHYLELSVTEENMVEKVCAEFDNVVVVINANNAMELGWVDDYPQIGAVILAPGTGNTGMAPLGQILSGAVNPSGRTADTYVKDLTQTPTWNNFGHFGYDNVDDLRRQMVENDGAYQGVISFVNYVEGVYVGYKFYETAAQEGLISYDDYVQYPFGYGLSYTSFTQKIENFSDSGDTVSFDVKVTNTGSTAGKEVVEVYFTPPYTNGGIEKASVNLVQFGKTGLLEPNASETVHFDIAKEDFAAYDDGLKISGGGYILEAGEYTLSVRSSSHTVLDEASFTVDSDVDYSAGRPSDNTPAVIHTEIVAGDKINLTYMPKGFGSENMSRLYMLKPAQGYAGITDAVVETVKLAGSRPCPPVYVGVGIGGTFDHCAFLAKKALTRDVGANSSDAELAEMEKTLLQRINGLNIGCQGFHGNTTAIGVAIEKAPTHIAGLPVAVNIQCHCVRCVKEEI